MFHSPPTRYKEQLKKRLEPAVIDKLSQEMQDGPLHDLLRVALHLGVRAS